MGEATLGCRVCPSLCHCPLSQLPDPGAGTGAVQQIPGRVGMRLLGKGPDTPCPVERGPLRIWCEGQVPRPHPNRALGQPTSPAGDSDAGRLQTQLWVSEQREGAPRSFPDPSSSRKSHSEQHLPSTAHSPVRKRAPSQTSPGGSRLFSSCFLCWLSVQPALPHRGLTALGCTSFVSHGTSQMA